MYSDVAVIIPSRLGSTRLKEKPLELIGEKNMIECVFRQVQQTGIEHVYVATDSELIANKVSDCGGKYIMTDPRCDSGTDRVYDAFKSLSNNKELKYVVNVQGDMPFVKPSAILTVIEHLRKSNYGIMTPVVKVNKSDAEGDGNVKVVVNAEDKALYFSRSMIPSGAVEFLYHIGIYGFRKEILEQFVRLPQASLEQQERLEQLRALYNGIDIGVCYVDDIPISVDTSDDLDKARRYYANLNV